VHTNQPPHNPRWEALSLSRALDRMSDVAYCPRCEAVCVEDGDHCAQCERCLYVFCTFCSDSYHPGTECLDPHEVRGGGA
jgi:E3 ubiquitin-protein ligase RNF14